MGLMPKRNDPVKERLKVSTILIPILFLLGIVSQSRGVVDYCDEHTFETNSSYLQFTKEISNRDYALANKFKSLHCCAKGYRSIEWYKDGIAYPWPSGVSNLILYPESANQTVYAQTVSPIDSGNYSCVVRNDSHVIRHSVLLVVLEAEVDEVGYTGSPLPTYEPKDRFASKGDSARFFCEAFVGRVDLPDAKSEVRWWRSIPSEGEVAAEAFGGQDGSIPSQEGSGQEFADGFPMGDPSRHHHHHHFHRKHHVKPKPRFHQEVVPREDNQILGAYLLIREVQNEDFGEYRCSVRNAAGEHTLLMSSWLKEKDVIEDKPKEEEEEEVVKSIISHSSWPINLVYLSLFLITLALLLYLIWNWKQFSCNKKAADDGKEYDVCIFYENKGTAAGIDPRSANAKDVVLSHIIPNFELHQGYHCFTHPLPPPNHSPLTVPQEVRRAIEKSRRLLIVVNPAYKKIPPKFCDPVSELLKLHPKAICLFIETEEFEVQKMHLKVKQNNQPNLFKWDKKEVKCGDDLSAEEVLVPDIKKFGKNTNVILWPGIPPAFSPPWAFLLLQMPPKKMGHNSNLKTVPIRRSASHNTLSNSHESLQVLV